MSDKPTKLWNKNFILLSQGRFVSLLGSVLFSVALGFWVLDKTGSGTLMGSIMAASSLPRIIISPFAGPLVDRFMKNRILVWCDFIIGLIILAATVVIYMDLLEIWMVFVIAISAGVISAFFNPASTAIIPEIVPAEKMTNAGSVTSMLSSATDILGSPAGGILYSAFGAPVLFLINGISYIFSAITEIFIKVPKKERHPHENYSYWDDFKSGIKYTISHVGIRNFFLLAALMNFMMSAAIVTLMPYFQRTEGLGADKYGITMSLLTVGMFIGGLMMSFIKVTNKNRFKLLFYSLVFAEISLAVSLLWGFYPMLVFVLFGGLGIVIVNVIIGAVLQLVIEPEMRGKFFAFSTSISAGLTPLGMALGGVLSDIFSIPMLFLIINLTVLVIFVSVILLSKKTRDIFYIPEEDKPNEDPQEA